MFKIKNKKSLFIDIVLVAIILYLIYIVIFLMQKYNGGYKEFANTFSYYATEDELTITEYKGTYANVIIPQILKVDGKEYTITRIEKDVFKDNSLISSVELPETIKYIGESSFENCTSLKKIVIPTDIERIGLNAFSGCTNLKEIHYNGVSENVDLPLYGNIFINVGKTEPVNVYIGENVVSIPAFLFASSYKEDCVHIGNVVFEGQNCTSIGESAFFNADITEELVFPDSVKNFGKNCFKSSTIKQIALGQNVASLPDYMFYNCKKLQQVTIPKNVELIGVRCFSNSNIISINLPISVKYIGLSAFGNSKLQIINYEGDEKDWKAISINVDKLTEFMNAKIIFGGY